MPTTCLVSHTFVTSIFFFASEAPRKFVSVQEVGLHFVLPESTYVKFASTVVLAELAVARFQPPGGKKCCDGKLVTKIM